jgi:predicted porin
MSVKRYFPLALLSTFGLASTGAWAQSSMSLYGALDITFGSYQYAGTEGSNDNKHTTKVDGNQMVTSYIGFKGVEDLGSGLKAGFALETFLQPDTGGSGRNASDVYWGRAANVWLQNSLGKITAGRQGNLLFGQVASYNPLGGAFGFAPAVRLTYGKWGNDRGDSSWSNAVGYTSPAMGGLTLSGQAQAGESATKAERSSYALGAAYTAGPFSAALGWQTVRSAEAPKPAPAAGSRQTFGLGSVGFDAGFAKLFGQYGQFEDRGFGASSMLTSLYQLGAAIPFGANCKLLTSVGQSKEKPIDNGTVVKAKHTIATVAYDHWLSKRTDVYVALMSDKEDRETGTPFKSGLSYAVGVRHTF